MGPSPLTWMRPETALPQQKRHHPPGSRTRSETTPSRWSRAQSAWRGLLSWGWTRAACIDLRSALSPPRARYPADKFPGDESGRQGSLRLVGLAHQHCQVVQRRAGVRPQVPQRVPLHDRQAERFQGLVRCPVVLHLQRLTQRSCTDAAVTTTASGGNALDAETIAALLRDFGLDQVDLRPTVPGGPVLVDGRCRLP